MKPHQQVLSMSTEKASLRSEVFGWSNIEDPALFEHGKPVGFTRSIPAPNYTTVLQALADGWRLLGQPVKYEEDAWDWWLVRDAEEQ